jgi:hypothetical protein
MKTYFLIHKGRKVAEFATRATAEAVAAKLNADRAVSRTVA